MTQAPARNDHVSPPRGASLVLDKLGADPAIASGTFVTTITDVVGFFAFLSLAAWWFGVPVG